MSGEVGLRYVCLPKRTGTVRLRQLHWAQRKACLANWRLLGRAPTLFAFLCLSLFRASSKKPCCEGGEERRREEGLVLLIWKRKIKNKQNKKSIFFSFFFYTNQITIQHNCTHTPPNPVSKVQVARPSLRVSMWTTAPPCGSEDWHSHNSCATPEQLSTTQKLSEKTIKDRTEEDSLWTNTAICSYKYWTDLYEQLSPAVYGIERRLAKCSTHDRSTNCSVSNSSFSHRQ